MLILLIYIKVKVKFIVKSIDDKFMSYLNVLLQNIFLNKDHGCYIKP